MRWLMPEGWREFADRTPLVDITLSDIMAERRKEFIGERAMVVLSEEIEQSREVEWGDRGLPFPAVIRYNVLPLPVEEEDYRPE